MSQESFLYLILYTTLFSFEDLQNKYHLTTMLAVSLNYSLFLANYSELCSALKEQGLFFCI